MQPSNNNDNNTNKHFNSNMLLRITIYRIFEIYTFKLKTEICYTYSKGISIIGSRKVLGARFLRCYESDNICYKYHYLHVFATF